MTDAPAAEGGRRWGSFRPWEIAVILIAIVLFVLAAFAGPRGEAPPPIAQPSASAPASPVVLPPASPTASPTPTPSPTLPADLPTGSPVATVEQILAEEVGDYMLADRSLSESGARSGALQSVELRYVLSPPDSDTDIFHAIEIHADDTAATERVKTFAAAMEQTGYRVLREQSLRDDDGSIQGYFVSLRGEGQPLLLWSNRNATFSLGGGPEADVNRFYDDLPY